MSLSGSRCLGGEVYRENESSIFPVEKMYSYKPLEKKFHVNTYNICLNTSHILAA